MANPRKVQGDIDKLVKKISEGIEEYEVIYDKFAEAATPALKERFEGDLKKEIKKLQRLREQVKALVQSSEVKDKKDLEKARRRVEEKMEAFKIVERETKTKAFSKEGLANLTSNQSDTPQQRTEGWIKTAIEELKEQTETAEFEIQAEGGGAAKKGGKKKKEPSDDPREIRLLRLRANMLKLEQLLRSVVNEDLAADEVDEIEDDVQRFIDDNAEEDFEEDLELFDRFDLPDLPPRKEESDDEDEEKAKAAAAAAAAQKTPATPAAAPPIAATAPALAASPLVPSAALAAKKVVPAAPTKAPDTPPSSASKTPLTPGATAPKSAASPAASTPVAAPAVAPKKDPQPAPAAVVAAPATTPFVKKSIAQVVAAAAAATAPAPAANKAPAAAPPAKSFAAAAAAAAGVNTTASAAQTPLSNATTTAVNSNANTPLSSSAAAAKQPMQQQASFNSKFGSLDDQLGGDDSSLLDDDLDEANDDTFGDDAMPVSNSTSLAEMAGNRNLAEFERQRMASKTGGGGIMPPRAVSSTDSPDVSSPNQSHAPPVPPQPAAHSPQQPIASAATATVWSALLKANQPSEEKVAMHRMLDMSLQNLPHPHDVERVRAFVPPNPYQTKPHHPQVVHPGFSSPDMFRRFDPDTLFFVFYYQQQTYQQYLAAKELKRQSFRYHKKFKTWFQRHDKPKESTDEFESGAYLYFDYENGWCQRIKNDFVFKYTYLEDELV